MSPAAAHQGQAGFTLLEILVGISILAIVVVVQVAPFQQTIESRDRAEAAVRGTAASRLALLRLTEELEAALVPGGDDPAFALRENILDQRSSELLFATTGARRVQTGPRDPVERVRYALERDPDDSRRLHLIKQQLPSIAAEGVEPVRIVVLEDVTAFEVEALSVDGWTTSLELASGLPRALRLRLSIEGTDGVAVQHRTTVTLPLGEKS